MQEITQPKNRVYEVRCVCEIGVKIDGFEYLVIFGEHLSGWFVSIPCVHMCCNIGNPLDFRYNTLKIVNALGSCKWKRESHEIATAIAEHYKKLMHEKIPTQACKGEPLWGNSK